MMRPLFGYAAALLAAIWAAVHIFIGTNEAVTPLMTSDLPDVARGALALVWHMLSLLLVVLAGTLAIASWKQIPAAMWAAVAQATALAMIGLVLPPLMGFGYGLLPQGWLFVPVVLLGALALRSGLRNGD